MGQGMRKDTSAPIWGDLLAFQYATFYTYDASHKSPSVFALSSREQGRAKWEEGVQRTLHRNFACHSSQGSPVLAS
jgi:hypothetical protein